MSLMFKSIRLKAPINGVKQHKNKNFKKLDDMMKNQAELEKMKFSEIVEDMKLDVFEKDQDQNQINNLTYKRVVETLQALLKEKEQIQIELKEKYEDLKFDH